MALCLNGAQTQAAREQTSGLNPSKEADTSGSSTHCEDPPVLQSLKGNPFTDGRTRGGGHPGDGFCLTRSWLVSGQHTGPSRPRAGPPTTSLPRGNVPHHRGIRLGSQGLWAPVRGTGSPPCHPEDREASRGAHFHQVSQPCRGRAPRDDPGTPGQGEGPPRDPRRVEPAPAGGTHAHGSVISWGLRPAPLWEG